MFQLMKNIFVNKKKESPQNVFNQIHYQKTANIVGILTSRPFTFFHLVTDFSCGPNVRRFARCDRTCFIYFFTFFQTTYFNI